MLLALARDERPDTSSFTDPEIAVRLDLKNHIGFVLAADTPQRVTELLTRYIERISHEFHASMPAAEKAAH